MRLADLRLGLVRAALGAYERVAWEGRPCPKLPRFDGPDDASVETVLHQFEDEAPARSGSARRFILRLGNCGYPFMKFVLEEHLILGEFFFAVDTHDEMFKGTPAEAEELAGLRARNAGIKGRVEALWAELGLPTVAHLKGLVETRPMPRLPRRGQRVLIVDDDVLAAETLGLLLEARGFDVERLGDGREALERADPARHQLLIMDVEMPVTDGFTACRQLKADERRRRIPILLATAGARRIEQDREVAAIDLARECHADAFLTKPFPATILFSFLDHLLPPPPGHPGAAG